MRFHAAIDTNVILAAADEGHTHHPFSIRLIGESTRRSLAVPSHCFAEAYSQLTRRTTAAAFHWPAQRAFDYLHSLADRVEMIALTPVQTLEAVRCYAQAGGIGARLYDHLIGEAAIAVGVQTLITWNLGHMRSLFPNLDVLTPEDAITLSTTKDRG